MAKRSLERAKRGDALALYPDESQREARASAWRTARIARFTEKQRRIRNWINCKEIAEWCSAEDGSILKSEKKLAAAYDTLAQDILEGEFEVNGRSRVLFLHPWSKWARMTRQWLTDIIETHNYNQIPQHRDNNHYGRAQYLTFGRAQCFRWGRTRFLPYCWVPRDLLERWLAKHRLPASPARFEPLPPEATQATTTGKDISGATKLLHELLKLEENKSIKRDDALAKCREKYPNLSERAFLQSVWPDGRVLAGLPRRAQHGRKPSKPK
jgi:hypothetical protein